MFLGHASPYMPSHYEQLKDEHVLAERHKHSPVDSLRKHAASREKETSAAGSHARATEIKIADPLR